MKSNSLPTKILVIFGTRPEAIKFAPVIDELNRQPDVFQTVIVSSSQHTDLLTPFIKLFDLKIDYDLQVMTCNQTPNEVFARVMASFDKILVNEKPDVVLVQGDTTTACAATLASFQRKIPVGHIEAGMRSGDWQSPFPEEMNRRLISQMATFHFAVTKSNQANLLAENINPQQVFLTGNPVVDALKFVAKNFAPGEKIAQILEATAHTKRILLTTHRRESFGAKMGDNLKVLRDFVAPKKDVSLIFPVHPNPNVVAVTNEILRGANRVYLLEPLDYVDFVALMKNAWLIVSDSGGIQEEAPSLGKPLLILRENTERPEAVECGVAQLVGGDPQKLAQILALNYHDEAWIQSVKKVKNPFGDGTAAQKIAKVLRKVNYSF